MVQYTSFHLLALGVLNAHGAPEDTILARKTFDLLLVHSDATLEARVLFPRQDEAALLLGRVRSQGSHLIAGNTK